MSAIHGQASVEYAGLLALAAVLGAALALIAGPPLVGAVRDALASALSGSSDSVPAVVSAADIADVQAALAPGGEALTPDAALLALAQRDGSAHAGEIAESVLLAMARASAPWLGRARTYRAWLRLDDGPYQASSAADGDRDVEQPTGPPIVSWVTVAAQHRTLAAAFAHHASATAIALDIVGLVPGLRLAHEVSEEGARRVARIGARRLPHAVDAADLTSGVVEVVNTDDGGVPAGMRTGDVVIAWPVHRTFWRSGRSDRDTRIDLGHGFGLHEPVRDYLHVVFLRPRAGGLAVISEGFGT